MIARTVHKLFWDFDKEERWLNEMAARGLNLVNHRWGTYEFETGTPGQWIYRIQFLEVEARKPASREYIDFVTETGAEPVDTHTHRVYFRKHAADGPFELFTDLDSRLAYYRRILTFYSTFTWMLVMLMVVAVSKVVNLAEEAIGRFWGLPIFIPYVVLMVVFFTHMMRLAKRVRELEARRALEE
ncbi:MAG: DUF2812 domain-containing protein [Coriobacteriia bacterium]|nr:DUF2812 domain-containing protein [Coriobacteriia bacterium]